MKIIVLGATGHIGRAIAWDLCGNKKVTKVGLASNQQATIQQVADWIGSEKTDVHVLDLFDRKATGNAMTGYDVAVIALPGRRLSYEMIELAIELGINCVDILEEYHRVPEAEEIEGLEIPQEMTLGEYGASLHESAVKKGVLIVDGMGFAPGLSNITLAHGIRQLDKATDAVARVGGVPDKASAKRHPLNYMITWAFQHVLREYMVNTTILQDGKPKVVEALHGYEWLEFKGLDQEEALECFITPGMPSFVHTHPNLNYFAEKTIRWPGHWQAIQTLKECGMLETDPVEYDGKEIVPRTFLSKSLEPKLRPLPEDEDICIMLNTVKGTRSGDDVRIDYLMWAKAEPEKGLSAMARVTGFTAAIAAVMVGSNVIRKTGICSPEEAIDEEIYLDFMEELKKRTIEIVEVNK